MFYYFFKRKTAYEMRISDWSSDVCSSGLGAMRKWILALVAALSGGAALAATPATVVFDAENMTCPACGITIRKALEKVPGVTETKVDTRAETVTVTFD